MSRHIFAISGGRTCLDGRPLLLRGLRSSWLPDGPTRRSRWPRTTAASCPRKRTWPSITASARPGKPYVETEGSPRDLPVPGGYWGPYSKRHDAAGRQDDTFWDYINTGVYTEAMKRSQIALAADHFDRGDGYFLASTWLQAAPPAGPHHDPGGDGSPESPGIAWWLAWLSGRFGPYRPQS